MAPSYLKIAHWTDPDDINSSPAAIDHTIRRQVEKLTQQRVAQHKVVSLNEFREIKKNTGSRSILVVDDEEVMRNALRRILTAEGHRVHLAADGLEFSKAIEDMRFDLILMDVNLPWVDGCELCQILKNNPNFSRVPLVMVSARTSEQDVEKGMAAGADDYIVKPFDIEAMLKVLNKHLIDQAV